MRNVPRRVARRIPSRPEPSRYPAPRGRNAPRCAARGIQSYPRRPVTQSHAGATRHAARLVGFSLTRAVPLPSPTRAQRATLRGSWDSVLPEPLRRPAPRGRNAPRRAARGIQSYPSRSVGQPHAGATRHAARLVGFSLARAAPSASSTRVQRATPRGSWDSVLPEPLQHDRAVESALGGFLLEHNLPLVIRPQHAAVE